MGSSFSKRPDEAHALLSERIGPLVGRVDEDVPQWLKEVVTGLQSLHIARENWIRVTLRLMSPELKLALVYVAMQECVPDWMADSKLRCHFASTEWPEFEQTVLEAHGLACANGSPVSAAPPLALEPRGQRTSIRGGQGTLNPELQAALAQWLGSNYRHVLPVLLRLVRMRHFSAAAVRTIIANIGHFRTEHPYIAGAIGVAIMAGGGVVVAQALFAILLPVLGFGPLGPVAGTLAPWLQSAIYGANTGGLFSLLQAAGMTFVGPSVLATAVAGSAMKLGHWLGFSRGGDMGNNGNNNGNDDNNGSGGQLIIVRRA